MGRIIAYQYDNVIENKDAWVGTEARSGRTKQYTAEAVARYLNINGKVSIGGQMVFKYVSSAESQPGTFALPTGGNIIAFSDVIALTFSVEDLGEQETTAFLNYLVGSDILISSQDELSHFGHYTIDSYTLINASFYRMNVTFKGGNNSLRPDLTYNVSNFILAANSGDKNFIFTQSSASDTWNIQHNLDKFPSVSVVDSAESLVVGDVAYVDSNNVTLTFNGAFSGKAYLN